MHFTPLISLTLLALVFYIVGAAPTLPVAPSAIAHSETRRALNEDQIVRLEDLIQKGYDIPFSAQTVHPERRKFIDETNKIYTAAYKFNPQGFTNQVVSGEIRLPVPNRTFDPSSDEDYWKACKELIEQARDGNLAAIDLFLHAFAQRHESGSIGGMAEVGGMKMIRVGERSDTLWQRKAKRLSGIFEDVDLS